jgi:hypothetical protein
MSIGGVTIVTWLLALPGAMAFEGADSLPVVVSPPLGEAQWVAEHMRLNGLPMSLKIFVSPLGIDEVFTYYESWGRTHGMKDANRSRRDEWQVLGMKSIHHLVSIQARPTSRGVEGTITVSPIPDGVHPDISTRLPHPPSVRVVSVQQYQDGDVASEQISMVSLRSASIEARAFADMLARAGWRLARNEPASGSIRGYLIEAQRGPEHLVMTLQPDRTREATTAIVIVWKKS